MEFFAANIRNANTREVYVRAVANFLDWSEARGVRRLADIQPIAVTGYIEDLATAYETPTVKQHLAAVRMLFDGLVVGQIVPSIPASPVRGPKHVVKRGKTPVLTADEARRLLDSIDITAVTGLRDRALIGVMVYSFARVSAAISMRVEDSFRRRQRLRHRRTKGSGSRAACLTMVFKLMQFAAQKWRLLNGPQLLPKVIQGMQFIDGIKFQVAA